MTKEVLLGRQISRVPHQGAVRAASTDSSSSRQAPAAQHARRRRWLHSGIMRRQDGSSARMRSAQHRVSCTVSQGRNVMSVTTAHCMQQHVQDVSRVVLQWMSGNEVTSDTPAAVIRGRLQVQQPSSEACAQMDLRSRARLGLQNRGPAMFGLIQVTHNFEQQPAPS